MVAAAEVVVDGVVADGVVAPVALAATTTSPLPLRATDPASGLALGLVSQHTWPPETTTVVNTMLDTITRLLPRPTDPTLAPLLPLHLPHRLAHPAPRQDMAVQDAVKSSLQSLFLAKNVDSVVDISFKFYPISGFNCVYL